MKTGPALLMRSSVFIDFSFPFLPEFSFEIAGPEEARKPGRQVLRLIQIRLTDIESA